MRQERLSHRKIPVTQSKIEPATFRFIAQCLNQLRHRVPALEGAREIFPLFSAFSDLNEIFKGDVRRCVQNE
jgi:hypothetical protein